MPKLEKGPVPLYFQLEQILRSRITAGEIRPSERLPTELELRKEFGVSSTTVRQAFKALELDGLIRREQGRGTTLIPSEEKKVSLKLHGAFQDFLQTGTDTKLKLTSKQLVTPDKAVIVDMNLEEGEAVYLFEGIRTESRTKKLLSYFQAHVPRAIGSKISIKKDKENPFLIRRVEDAAGDTTYRIRQVAKALPADARLADIIGVKKGTPLLLLKRVYFTREGKALERALSYHPWEAFEQEIEMVMYGV